MKINETTAIATSQALLVPYEAHHVRQYHSWMQDPDIQEATASEPMTMDEEYENQQSWRTSSDKLTFIICAPPSAEEASESIVKAKISDADVKMRGDINFFLYPYESDDDDEAATVDEQDWCTGEVDVMIASTAHRGQGFGRAAVCALLVYLRAHIDDILGEYAEGKPAALKGLMVKIKEGNAGSRALFKKLGFVQKGEVNYFGEVVLVMPWEAVVMREWWDSAEGDYREVRYEDPGNI
ncbi:acyl-CoA N-acyltransferase [Ilyonectria sp. MPI-CAGE-AT-0026]|nr:acyl-CoA N-acyltransferase [Ilyonectria sp. MPI-CAGE-AT-0026]